MPDENCLFRTIIFFIFSDSNAVFFFFFVVVVVVVVISRCQVIKAALVEFYVYVH